MEHKHYYYDVGGWEALTASSTGNRSLARSLELLELLLLLLLVFCLLVFLVALF